MNTNDHVQSTLSKLDSILGKDRKKGKVDFKELNELKKKSFIKLKEGKNQVAIVKPQDAADPFFVWGFHNSLQETSYWSVPCNGFNKNEECVVCNVVKGLQQENYEGNKHLWYPIRQQTEIYAPAINLESEQTITEGLKWLRLPKTVLGQLTEWLRTLEPTEHPFYSDDEPQKIMINYDKTEQPATQYKLVNKNMKAFSAQQLADWRGNLKPVHEFMISKRQEDLKTLVDGYFERIAKELDISTSPDSTTPVDDTVLAKSVLDSLKTQK